MREATVRAAIVEVNAELERRGMNICASGNISVRWKNGVLITPAGCRVETLEAQHIVFARFDGGQEGELRPSSELAMHQAVYQNVPSAQAVVHTHADYCVALAACRKPIPAFHYMVQGFGGMEVPCVDYHPFGSQELAAAAGKALSDHSACLLANHGMLARGANLASAFDTALKLEALARQYALANVVGNPVLLTAEDWALVREQYRTYGKAQQWNRTPRWHVP